MAEKTVSAKPAKRIKEPPFHIVKRDGVPGWKKWVIRIISVFAGLVFCGILTLILTKTNPLTFYGTMINGAFGSAKKIWKLAQDTAILLCIALAVTPAFRMRFWNIGAEGQVLMGGLATAAVMIKLGNKLPTALLFIVMIAVSIIAGAVWALIPAFFKAHWNTNETLFTLMMNYVAIQIVSYFVYEWSVPAGSGHVGVINPNNNEGWIPSLAGQNYLINILVVAALTVIMYVYMKYSKHGYEIAVVGESENTARYIGLDVKKVILRTLLLSGAMCGIAGFLLVSGTEHSISTETAGGRGFTAIIVSWMGQFNPFYMIITSLLIAFFDKGASQVSMTLGLNDSFSDIITGIIIFFIIGSEFFINYSIRKTEKVKEVAA